MPPATAPCEQLSWDTAWWGIPTARVSVPLDAPGAAQQIDAWCLDHGIGLLYLLVPSADIAQAQLAEANDFRIMDVRVTLAHDRPGISPSPPSTAVGHRIAKPHDAAALGDIAAVSYRVSRFYADPHLPDARCDDLYRRWIERDLEDPATTVLVDDRGDSIAGFLSVRNEPGSDVGTISLVGVSEAHRRQGVGARLLEAAIGRFGERRTQRVEVVTQGRNSDAIRLYQRQGFAIQDVGLWYHKWYRP